MDPRRPEDLEPRHQLPKNKDIKSFRDSGMKLERKDIPAIIISALLVFGPIFIVFALIALWALS